MRLVRAEFGLWDRRLGASLSWGLRAPSGLAGQVTPGALFYLYNCYSSRFFTRVHNNNNNCKECLCTNIDTIAI
ncbi:hypothetical protein BJX70DRAFT_193272 [Aspergillus crustosus]